MTATRPAADDVPGWVTDHYALVDAADLDAYIQDFDPGVELRFASAPPVSGREAARAALARGHAEHEMAHTVVNCWGVDETTIIEFDVVYTYPDGHSRGAPSVAIIHRGASGLIDSLRVYVERPH
jgi:hypothetical protein